MHNKLFLPGIDTYLWQNVVYQQYCYLKDKRSLVKLPFFQLGFSEIQSIATWTHITSSTYINREPAYSSSLDWVSTAECNIFVYVLY